MFCKKCGKELSEGINFCPACGEKVVLPQQPSKGRPKNSSKMNKAVSAAKLVKDHEAVKSIKKSRKGIVLAGLAAVLAIGLLAGLAVSKLSGGSKKEGSGFNKEAYADRPVTKSQIRELEDIYHAAYEDEKEGIDLYIAGYTKYYNEFGDTHEMFQSMQGMTEDLYQAMNDWDPNLKDVIAADAGARFGGNSYLGSYVVNKGVSAALSDTEFGSEVRNTMENLMLGGLECLTIAALKEQQENAVQSDAMMPIAVAGDYAFVRSNGTIGDMLYELKLVSGYQMAVDAIDERLKVLSEENPLSVGDFWTEDKDELFETYKIAENYYARRDFLDERRQEWEEAFYKWADDFLVRVGIEDRESTIQTLLWSEEQKAEKAMLDYFHISDKEYEKLKEKYETDDIWYIIQETEGTEALEKYEMKEMENYEEEKEMIQGKFVYSIIDKEGTVYSSFLAANGGLDATINEDGMCSIWTKSMDTLVYDRLLMDGPVAHIIMDKEENTIFKNDTENTKGSVYYDVTHSGNVLKKSFETDSSRGEDNQVLELARPDGTSEKLMEGKEIILGKPVGDWDDTEEDCTDYYEYTCEDHSGTRTSGIIDVSTGKLLTGEEFKALKNTANGVGDEFLITDDEKWEGVTILRLNENYVLKDNAICDNFGKEVKDLSKSEGVADILYIQNCYWVLTEGGWYYILDENFNEILNPVRLPEGGEAKLTEYGLLASETFVDETGEFENREIIVLYNEKGEKEELLEKKKGDLEFESFLCHSGYSLVMNLHTREPLLLSTPETPTVLELE